MPDVDELGDIRPVHRQRRLNRAVPGGKLLSRDLWIVVFEPKEIAEVVKPVARQAELPVDNGQQG